jgi:DNA gyrase subunit A
LPNQKSKNIGVGGEAEAIASASPFCLAPYQALCYYEFKGGYMEIGTVIPINIEDEIQSSYLDYAMSVIVSRALPDARDGLKPVQRRILYAMDGLGLRHTTPFKKSARIVGEVLGKYHPHGDAPVYEAMVRMAQDFSMRYPLIDGQGNFGSLDNDPPAAMRYTEARLTRIAEEMLSDIDKDTVDFSPNFDSSSNEPTVLPTKLPNLLLNGASGIAVGMATNIPPHNLRELCDAICYLLDNPNATIEELLNLIPGPDFPGGGLIIGREGIKSAYATGHGKVIIRAKANIEEVSKGRWQIVVSELPFQTNKAELVERIASLVRSKRLEGIAELRDESSREGIRIVIELKRDAQPKQVLNNLYKHTAMQSAFFANMLALVDVQPRVINLKAALQHYIDFRRQVLSRRTRFELTKAEERAHILEGLKMVMERLSEVITTIQKSESAEAAKGNLMREYSLSQTQAQAILEMQLRRLSALEQRKLNEEYTEVLQNISYLEDILGNPKGIDSLIKRELEELSSQYSSERRTQISDEELEEFSAEDLIPHQQMVVTLSQRGYIKRLLSENYHLQHRGGRGVLGMATKEADAISHLSIADTHDTLLLFTNRGRVLSLKCHRIPQEGSRQAKGMPIQNLLPLDAQERVTAVIAVANWEQGEFILLATRLGKVKRTELSHFSSVRPSGVIAIALKEGDELVSAGLAAEKDEAFLLTEGGRALRFAVADLRPTSRLSGSVRGIRLNHGDKVVGMDIASPGAFLLTISANGYGKRTPVSQYRVQRRGSSGVKTYHLTLKTGSLVAGAVVLPSQELMVISKDGLVIRMLIKDVTHQGRSTKGVSLMRLAAGDMVSAIACLAGGDGGR